MLLEAKSAMGRVRSGRQFPVEPEAQKSIAARSEVGRGTVFCELGGELPCSIAAIRGPLTVRQKEDSQ